MLSAPFSIDQLQFSDKAYLDPYSLDRVLFTIPGVFVNNRFNASQGDRITLRGIGSRAQFGIRGIKIILDDIPLTFPDGQSQLNNLDLNSIESIEVIRGPSSFLYGNAAGGVINIRSKTNNNKAGTFSPGFMLGSFGQQKYSLAGNVKILKQYFSFSVSRTIRKGYREHSASQSDLLNFIYSSEFYNNLKISAVLNYNNSPYLLNPSSLDKATSYSDPKMVRTFVKMQGAGKRVQQIQSGLNFKYSVNDNTKLSLTVFGIRRELFNAIPGSVIKLDRFASGVDATLRSELEIFSKRIDLLFGINYSFQNDERKEYLNNGLENYTTSYKDILSNIRIGENITDNNERINSYGLFNKISINILTDLDLTLGQRFDMFNFDLLSMNKNNQQLSLNNWSPMIGITYNPYKNITLFTNYSSAFQTPTFNEITNNPDPSVNSLNRLKPEHIESIELGLRGWYERIKSYFSLSFYAMNITDMLIPYQLEDSESEIVYHRNIGEVANIGMEASLTWYPFNSFSAGIHYAFINSEFLDFNSQISSDGILSHYQLDGNKVPGISPHVLRINLNYSPVNAFDISLFVNYTAQYFANDFNGPQPGEDELKDSFIVDDYFLTDLHLSYSLKIYASNLQLYTSLNNLLNVKYTTSIVPNASFNRFFEPGFTRNLTVGLKLFIE